MQRRLWYHSLLAMVLVFGLGISTVYAAPSQFTQDYYGENGSSYVNVIGTTHSTPELTLSGGTLEIDWTQLREGDATGYGVFFEYIESDPATEANITLTAGAKISLISDGDFRYLDLMGIYTDNFAESHVTLLDNSSIFVSAQGESSIYSGGVALDNIYAVETAAVTLDGGSTITANAAAISGLNGSDAMARGVSLSDDAHAKVTLDNGSAIIAEASAQYTGSEADPGNTEATAYGIDADSSTQVEVTLSGASKVSSKATAVVDDEEIDGYTGATATGIYAYGDTITVDLAEASVVAAQATAADVQSYGIQIEAVDHGEVNLDGASRVSSVATSTGNDGFAQGIGVSIEAQSPDTAILSLHHDSSIDTAASGAVALTIGGLIQSSPHGVATIDGGSTITATSTAASNSTTGEAFSVAGATAFATYNVAEVELTLNDAQLISTMTATATDTATDDIGGYQADALIAGEATPGGILISDYTTADVNLTDATISVAAEATASSITGDSRAMSFDDDSDNPTWASGLQVMGRTSGGNATINLLRSDINVNVKTTAGDVASTLASGITMYNDSGQDHVSLSLQDSNISVVTTAAATAEGGAVIVEALGIYTESVDGDISFDNTILNVKALSPTVGAQGIAAGVVIENSSASTLALQNHSQIVATQSAGLTAEGLNGSVGVYAANTAITVDSTSSIGADWAVYSAGGVSVENSGLLAGRLQVGDLNNASSGVFQATFGREDGFAYPEAGEDYYFNVTSGATLDNGTTFRIVPTDNLGFTAFGDTQKYALLNSDSGTWTQTELNLTTQSPLLGLSWAEESDGSKLIVTATLLSPEDSGISGNAQGAYRAAMDDGLFDIASDPEKWVPNVSGAFLSGMIQTLGSSHVNIGNRLGVLMGMNSGDEVAASNGMWFSIRYTEADQSRRDGIDGFDADTTGYSLGFDREIGNAVIGIAYTHGNTDADADDNSATFDMTDDLLSLYGSYDGGNWYTEAIFSIGFGDVDSVRYDTDQLLHGDYDSDSYNAKVDVGMKLNAGGVQVNPLFAMEYSTKDYDSYTEAGGSRALHIESQDYELFKVGAGVNASQEFQRNWGIITPEVSAMLNYDMTNDRVVTTANFVGGSTSFVAKGIEPADTSWDLGAAVTITGLGNKNVSFRLGYDYSGRADFNAHSFIGKLRFEF